MDIYDYIAIAILLLIIFVVYRKNKEHLMVGSEPVLNVAKIYADASGTAAFNNVTISGKLNAPNDKNYVWGLNSSNNTYRCLSPCTGLSTWEKINGENGEKLKKINIGKDYIFGIDTTNKILRCKKPCDTGTWEKIPGDLIEIAGDNFI
jgi:hypothetical protein